MRGRLPVRPMTGQNPDSRYPVDCLAAARAVEHELSQIALEVGLHLQELEAKHLRLVGDGVGAVQAGVDSLIDDRARGCRLLARGSNGTLEDVALLPGHSAMLALCHDEFLRVALIVGGSLGWTTILEVPRDIAMLSHPADNPADEGR